MVKRGTAVPSKLKDDSIVEAVFEIRFDTAIIPEVLIGRFIDNEKWGSREQRQLPAYNIPAQLRSIDPNIKFSPIIELAEPHTKSILRLGQLRSCLITNRHRTWAGQSSNPSS